MLFCVVNFALSQKYKTVQHRIVHCNSLVLFFNLILIYITLFCVYMLQIKKLIEILLKLCYFFHFTKTKHKVDRQANPTLLVSEVGYLVSRV